MPIFSQRRLKVMLEELSRLLDDAKYNDLKASLEHSNTKTALAAEAELSMLWAISRVADLDPAPTLPDGRKPDGRSKHLFGSGPAIIEIRSLSDDSFSGKEAMDRTANIIANYADRLRKRAGNHLYFEFNERSYWKHRYNRKLKRQQNRFHRERCADPAFKLTPDIEKQLKAWITAADWPNPPAMRITTDKTDVVVSWKKSTVPLFRTFCRMPPVAYDTEDNPVYKALEEKSDQIKSTPDCTLRCVILVDAGSDLLRRLRPMGAVWEIGGEAIIRHAIDTLNIDVVIVFSPYRQWEFGFGARSELLWKVSCFDRRNPFPDGEYARVEAMAAQLPRPRYEGYQARALHRQGGFAPDNRNWYLPTHVTTQSGGPMTVKLSAGLLHQYLAGAIDADRFREEAFNNENNLFTTEFMKRHAIQNVRSEAGGTDEDDDYVVFDLDIDWSKIARKSRGPRSGAAVRSIKRLFKFFRKCIWTLRGHGRKRN